MPVLAIGQALRPHEDPPLLGLDELVHELGNERLGCF